LTEGQVYKTPTLRCIILMFDSFNSLIIIIVYYAKKAAQKQ